MRSVGRRLPVRRRESGGCAGQLARLGLGLLIIIALYLLLVRPQISAALGRSIADLLAPTTIDAAAPLPAVIAALPTGTVTISEAEINGYLAEAGSLLPVESASVRLVADRAIVTVRAYGLTGTASSGIAVDQGAIVLRDPQIAGPLAALISASDLTATLSGRITAEFARQGRQIVAVTISDGYLSVVTTSIEH